MNWLFTKKIFSQKDFYQSVEHDTFIQIAQSLRKAWKIKEHLLFSWAYH